MPSYLHLLYAIETHDNNGIKQYFKEGATQMK